MLLEDRFRDWKLSLLTQFYERMDELRTERTRWDLDRAQRRLDGEYNSYAYRMVRAITLTLNRLELIVHIEIPDLEMQDFLSVSDPYVARHKGNVSLRKPALSLSLPDIHEYVYQRSRVDLV